MAKKKNRLVQTVRQAKEGRGDLQKLIDDVKVDVEPTKRFNADIPTSMHTQLKMRAAEEGRGMNDIFVHILREYLSK